MSGAPGISGTTRLYGIVGDPIAQARSPEVFTERFARAGKNAVLLPFHVPATRFEQAIGGILELANLDGLLVTLPFKARAVSLAARLGNTAQIVGAVNALRREHDGAWTGDMFDGEGFVNAVRARGASVEGKSVLMFGAGGAGSAIACALAQAGAVALDVVEPDAHRARDLVGRLTQAFPDRRFAVTETYRAGYDVVVNASPIGMKANDGLPAEIGILSPHTIVGDVVISDGPTAFIRHGLAHGCLCVAGRDMHAGQVEAILSFFGVHTPSPTQSQSQPQSQSGVQPH